MNLRLLLALGVLLLFGCAKQEKTNASGSLLITTTTGLVADMAQHLVGTNANVQALMGPGVDPHLYKASQQDLGKLQEADLVLYNGLHLEGKLVEILEKLGRVQPTLSLGTILPQDSLRKAAEFPGAYDPHIWFDVRLWRLATLKLSDSLAVRYPTLADTLLKNTQVYAQQLDSLDKWVHARVATLPPNQRVLVTAHDAFGYFGRAYGMEVHGLQGLSTLSEYGLKDVTSLVDLIVTRKIKAIFVESSVPRRAIEAVIEGCKQRGHDVTIGGSLYSDAMGNAGTPEGNYIGMVTANVNTIVEALK